MSNIQWLEGSLSQVGQEVAENFTSGWKTTMRHYMSILKIKKFKSIDMLLLGVTGRLPTLNLTVELTSLKTKF